MISDAQTEVVEFVVADDWEFERGYREFCLCVLNGNCGKLQLVIPRSGGKCMYDAYAYSYSEGVTIVKLTNPSEDCINPLFIYLSSRDKYLTDDLTNEYGRFEIREVKIIPKSNWNSKIEEYGMSYVCRSMAYTSSNNYSNSYSRSNNSNSYNSNNSNTYNSSSSGSELGTALLVGAGIIAAAVAIYDAFTDDSSNNNKSSSSSSTSSSRSSKADPCWQNDIPGSDKVWLSEADFSQIMDYWGNSMTKLTIKFHNDNNWPMKVIYQVVYKNEKSSDDPDMRWIVLHEDDKTTTQVISGKPGRVVECIKLRKIEPARY